MVPGFKHLIISLLFLSVSACVAPTREVVSSLSLRAEVLKGTEGAIPCDSLENSDRTVWLGPAHHFFLDRVKIIYGSGAYSLRYKVADEERAGYASFKDGLSSGRYVIEIDGRIVQAKAVDGRRTGYGYIDGGYAGFSEEEVEVLAAVLSESIRVEQVD